jgi:hypothetical protein
MDKQKLKKIATPVLVILGSLSGSPLIMIFEFTVIRIFSYFLYSY